MAIDKASGKREASRRCIIKKKAQEAKMDVEAYVKQHFQTTLSEYVTDAFHNKGKKPAVTIKDETGEESTIIKSTKKIANMTVEQFLQIYCGDISVKANATKLKKLTDLVGGSTKELKKVLKEQVLDGGNDMYLADVLEINLNEVLNIANPSRD